MALFLVDPLRKIPSTSEIPPQQQHWIREGVNLFRRMPVEMLDMIADNVESGMSEAEAKKYRLELMDERSIFVKNHGEVVFQREFSMCEH